MSFGFKSLAVEKQERLAELLALNNEKVLESEAKKEMEALLAEEQALQISKSRNTGETAFIISKA